MGASLFAFARMMLVLGLIIGALVGLSRFGQKRQSSGRASKKGNGHIEVLSRRSLGQHVSLLVVRVAGRTFLVGQSSQQMTLLAEFDGDEWMHTGGPTEAPEKSQDYHSTPGTASSLGVGPPKAWEAFIDQLREKTVRRS